MHARKKGNQSGTQNHYLIIFFKIKFRTLFLNIEKDALTFNASDKEFHLIIPLCRRQYFVLDLFRSKILIWFLDLILWLLICLLPSKFDSISSSILKCNKWKMQYETLIVMPCQPIISVDSAPTKSRWIWSARGKWRIRSRLG